MKIIISTILTNVSGYLIIDVLFPYIWSSDLIPPFFRGIDFFETRWMRTKNRKLESRYSRYSRCLVYGQSGFNIGILYCFLSTARHRSIEPGVILSMLPLTIKKINNMLRKNALLNL